MARPPRSLIGLLQDPDRAGPGMRRPSADRQALPDGACSVTEVLGRAERAIHQQIGEVLVVGEVSSFRRWRNGNWYFDLRDDHSALPAVMRSGHTHRTDVEPEDGMRVLAHGRMSLYRPQGKVQLLVTRLEAIGRGRFHAHIAQLEQKLLAEGLLDPARKKKLPEVPRRVGIVTSPQGAALQDMIKVLRRRSPGVSILLSPTRVQGNGASRDIAEALRRLDDTGLCDVILIGRGGGSLDDLMSFNMENVARAIVACRTPVISSVGHETDQTIADLVADVRAATPSHAAEIAVAHLGEVRRHLGALGRRLDSAARHRLRREEARLTADLRRLGEPRLLLYEAREDLGVLSRRLDALAEGRLDEGRRRLEELQARLLARAPARALAERRRRAAHLAERLAAARPAPRAEAARRSLAALHTRLAAAGRRGPAEARQRLREQVARLSALSPLAVLDRGYALVSGPGGVVTSASDLAAGDEVAVRFADGAVQVQVLGPGALTGAGRSPNEPPTAPAPPDDEG